MLIDALYTKALPADSLAVRLFRVLAGVRQYWDFVALAWDAADVNGDEPAASNRVSLVRFALASDPSCDYYSVEIDIPAGLSQVEIFVVATHEILFTGDTRFDFPGQSLPVFIVPAAPSPDLQTLYGFNKEFGAVTWSVGDTITIKLSHKDQQANGILLEKVERSTTVAADGSWTLYPDKGADVILTASNANGVYLRKDFTVTTDDSKDASTY